MTDKEQKAAAYQFASEWNGKGQEDEDCHKFWVELMENVLGVDNALQFLSFEKKVRIKNISVPKRIDIYIAASKVIIEQKSIDVNLDKPQPSHNNQTPFEQAKFYNDNLNYSERARWIIVSNFKEIRIYDMNDTLADPLKIMLSELPERLSAFDILKAEKSEHIKIEEKISVKAGALVGKLYDALINQYANPDDEAFHSLNKLCVRLVFCLYAEDSGIFADNQFHNYLLEFQPKHIRDALLKLFKILDTPEAERDPDEEESLLAFPYANGGLFSDEIRIPQFTEEIKMLLLEEASQGFDWSEISPTIFGAVFESTIEAKRRRENGMHYTSVENIHKVIDPLFLDDLRSELAEIKKLKQGAAIRKRVIEFQNKLASLKFLDPACGSGNFLTETYLSLRKLENEAIRLTQKDSQAAFDLMGDVIKVNISQFYGIEINNFAVTVAKTALWIAESQMKAETDGIIHMNLQYLPLQTIANIYEGNALRIDWESVVPKSELSYIMGNPPFVGHQWRSDSQADDMKIAFNDLEKHGKLDYVCSWYNVAANFIKDTQITVAFVSTNSICQGESVGILWRHIFEKKQVEIQFAHRTFIWDSEASEKAHVHCVIVGFSVPRKTNKKLYEGERFTVADHINGYLIDAPDVYIESRGKPLNKSFPQMSKGSQPTDGGYLILSETEQNEIVNKYPQANEFIKQFIGSDEFINNKKRYCIWLNGVSPDKYRKITPIMGRINKVAEIRKKSPTKSVQKDAEKPMLFTQIRQPETNYLVVPEVSSEKRKYIPIGFLSPQIICSNKLYLLPNATHFIFGILTSNVHMAWMRAVCGRMKSDYSYSPAVYNNFPWCTPTDEQKAKIEQTAQAILDARALYPNCSLADLYDELTMPPELRKAHQNNDRAVMQAYGFDTKITESKIVAELMRMYKRIIK